MTAWSRLLVIALLGFVGVGGWAGAQWVAGNDVTQKTVTLGRATVIRTVHVRVTQFLRGATAPARVRTVVTKRVARVVPRVRTVTGVVTTAASPSTVTDVRQQTVAEKQTVTHLVTTTVIVTNVETQPAQTVVRTVTTPPGHAHPKGPRETRTVTVVETVTVTVPTATVTVTVKRGH
jgi:hypothetical protein